MGFFHDLLTSCSCQAFLAGELTDSPVAQSQICCHLAKDLNPDDYEQEFVDPSHIEAIETNDKLKSVFPEVCSGQASLQLSDEDFPGDFLGGFKVENPCLTGKVHVAQ